MYGTHPKNEREARREGGRVATNATWWYDLKVINY
jgi:hypothetical protein